MGLFFTLTLESLSSATIHNTYLLQTLFRFRLTEISIAIYRKQDPSGTQPKEDHGTQQQRPREGLSACLAESRFDRGGYIRGHVVNEG